MNNPALAMFGLFIIASVTAHRAFIFAFQGMDSMMGARVAPFDLFLPSTIPKEALD